MYINRILIDRKQKEAKILPNFLFAWDPAPCSKLLIFSHLLHDLKMEGAAK